ncbi:hypothetical protein CDG81_22725 [Actinopolyspora erythraea]|uniref:Peptidase S1 domain-containing protein n=1 Tax=Actinopolyspora erythraea TaxID=414996 RepID=A0A223RXI9_9ACTN|nr:serine protease [Actinopolyspora erythraea]ASU80616.1 hypothetical protein CDG81_22725 [Actinopolyspora erythraea]
MRKVTVGERSGRSVRRRAGLVGAALAVTGLVATGTVLGASPAGAVAHGSEVRNPVEAPWQATLVLEEGAEGVPDVPVPRRASCGGALVSPRKVVTAAHCLGEAPPRELRRLLEIRVGATQLSRDPGERAEIADVAVHPDYRLIPSPEYPDVPQAASAAHDIAVLTLDRAIRGVRTLPVAEESPRRGGPAVFYGHGLTASSGMGDVLRRGVYRTGAESRCAAETPAVVDGESMMCGRGVRAQACSGDSGGPLVEYSRGRPRLIGVFSFGMETAGEPCGTSGPDFFTDVAATHDWLSARLGR